MPKRTEAIKRFLISKTHSDLAALYTGDMECQVNVGQDGGRRVDQEFKGRQWQAWTDDVQTWNSFRIPLHANTEPVDNDKEMSYDLSLHAEAIGMTGWDWRARKSRWVAFDFDSIVGHKEGLSEQELNHIISATTDIEWTTVRKSTGGRGLHIYVYLDGVDTANHTEHAGLARAILGKLSALTGHDFQSKVDTCGGNMWVWHRKMQGEGLKLIKQGTKLFEIPPNWQEHVKVVSNKGSKLRPQCIPDAHANVFEQLTSQQLRIPLDEDHKKLIEYLTENNCVWWWVQDHHMLVTHTVHLDEAHKALGLKGIFKTISQGKEKGHDHNCYMFPQRKGAWSVRRYSPGCQEAETWSQDAAGWTRCFYNKEPDLGTASKSYGGIEHPSGGYVFREAEVAAKAATVLGANITLPNWANGREAKLKTHKDGRLVVEMEQRPGDAALDGWLPEKGKWKRIFQTNYAENEPDIGNYDDLVRHLVTESGEDYGWALKSESKWRVEPLAHIKAVLKTVVNPKDVDIVLGTSVTKCWTLVNKPFMPEYPGDRQWNRDAAQFRFTPSTDFENLSYPNWIKVLNHCGKGLDDAVKKNSWCVVNGINSGADYLKCWIASLFQKPMEPLPYLFEYGPQNSGKSILHEAIAQLLTKGYKRADNSLISQSGFNGELEGALLCVVEETDLKRNQVAYNRIKDWVTSRELPIHKKGKTPYSIPNTTHWIQCANNYDACPVFAGDTRITMIFVDELDPIEKIPKSSMMEKLAKESPDFLAEILRLELPPPNDRLNIPVIATEDKLATEDLNLNPLQRFLKDHTHYAPGYKIKFGEFCARFVEALDPNQVHLWSKIRIGRELGPQFPKGRDMQDGAQVYIGNISWTAPTETRRKLIVVGEKLVST
jgi:hypothetical protein